MFEYQRHGRYFVQGAHALEELLAAELTELGATSARPSYRGVFMDADPATVISVLREMKRAGKGVIGMKILGAGHLRNRVEEALASALALDCVDCFTIGAESRQEMEDLVKKIPAASLHAA